MANVYPSLYMHEVAFGVPCKVLNHMANVYLSQYVTQHDSQKLSQVEAQKLS